MGEQQTRGSEDCSSTTTSRRAPVMDGGDITARSANQKPNEPIYFTSSALQRWGGRVFGLRRREEEKRRGKPTRKPTTSSGGFFQLQSESLSSASSALRSLGSSSRLVHALEVVLDVVMLPHLLDADVAGGRMLWVGVESVVELWRRVLLHSRKLLGSLLVAKVL